MYLASAYAQEAPEPPSPARQCADAAAGREAEVCLRLAADHPEAIDGIAAAMRTHMDRRSAGDRELLQALLWLMTDERAVEGAGLLGTLRDPRAIPPLVAAAESRSPAIAVASVEALGRYSEGLEPLSRFLLEVHLPMEVRQASARALGTMGGVDAEDVLLATLRRRNVPLELRDTMLEVVRANYPTRLSELGGQVGEDGSFWLAAGGGWGLGYTLYATGRFGQTDLGPLGAGSGALAGATTAYLVGRAWPMEAGDAAFVSTNGIAFGLGGHFLGRGLAPLDPERWSLIGGLAGETAGFGTGFLLRRAHRGTTHDGFEAAALSGTLALTLSSLVVERRGITGGEGAVDLAAGIGFVAGDVIGQLAAPHVKLSTADGVMITLAASYGFTAGLLAPRGGADRWPLPFAGAGAGALAAYALAAPVELEPDVVGGAALGVALGAGLGWGGGLLLDPDDSTELPEIGTLVGATGGVLVGGVLASRNKNPPEWSDGVAIVVATGFAGAQTAGWVQVRRDAGRPVSNAPLLLVPSVVGAVAAVSTSHLDIPATSSFAAVSLGLVGGYVAGVTNELAVPGDRGDRRWLPSALVGSGVGLGVGAVVMSPRVNVPVLVVGLADAGGVLGGSAAALGASFASSNGDVILGTSLAGATVGFAGGALLGTSLAGKTRDVAFLVPPSTTARFAVVPTVFATPDGSVPGAIVVIDHW